MKYFLLTIVYKILLSTNIWCVILFFICCRPAPGELRRVHIDKSAEPLGIQISCLESGGVFVSTVNEHSLASQVGLQVRKK